MRRADFKRQPNPQIEEELTVRIQINPDAAVGDRELRLLTKTGMSNPLWFYVGQYPEIREKEPNDITPDPSVYVKLPAVINGQVMPGDVDRFAFEAKKGAKLVAHCAARELIPTGRRGARLVPGRAAPLRRQGQRVACRLFGFRHDPVMLFEIPKDGKYVIEVHDSIFRGREDFVYRISIGEFFISPDCFRWAVGSARIRHRSEGLESAGQFDPLVAPDRGRPFIPSSLKRTISSNRVAFLRHSSRSRRKGAQRYPETAQARFSDRRQRSHRPLPATSISTNSRARGYHRRSAFARRLLDSSLP